MTTLVLNLTTYQVQKLAEYCMDISKGMLLVNLTLPFVWDIRNVLLSTKSILFTFAFLSISLWLAKHVKKEVL